MIEKTTDYSGHQFLIADDKAFLRNTIQSMLVRCRAGRIEHASNGAEAMKVLAESHGAIDCVLCDWNMEPVDGLELLRAIRAGRVRNTLRDLRVIMLTGHADEHVVRTALAMDANGYVVKPMSMDKLVDAINHAFSKPTALKPANDYDSIGIVDLPEGALPTSGKRTPPWVLWSGMREGQRRNWAKRLEQIRHAAAEKTARGADENRLVVNRQRQDVASIPAGKVLAEDIHSEDGQLLLAAGTVLTKSLLERLRELADDSAVDVQLLVGDFKD